jgi:hypothetical protein
MIDGGPTKTLGDEFEVHAVDSLSITVDKGTTSDKSIEVQPGDIADVKLLYIKSSLHEGVSYKLSDGSTDSASVDLDTDHILNSSEIVELLNVNPKFIKFQNSDNENNADIEILVARMAAA